MNISWKLTNANKCGMIILRWRGKVALNAYTSESGIVETDYKLIVKEHLWANYRKRVFLSRLVRLAIRYLVARFVRTEKRDYENNKPFILK